MRTLRAVVAAIAVLGLGIAATARADADDLTVHRRGSPAGIVLRDTVTGGLVGTAVGGGVILYNMGIQNNKNYDWGRTLAWGAVIGLGAGLIWGVVDAASGPSYAMTSDLHAHDGQSMSLDVRSEDQSGTELFPLVNHRF